MLDVLVVSECFEAGTGAAVESIATELKEVRFHLLWAGDARSLSFAPFASAERLAPTAVARVRQLRRLVRDLGVDVVHAHSSWAGLYARIGPLPVPVVYQPHCLGFANPGRSWGSRVLSKHLERILAPRTSVLVAVSDAEAGLAQQLGFAPERVRIVANSSVLRRDDRRPRGGRGWRAAAPRVLMIGRLAAQKDPSYFAELSQLSRRRALPFQFVWIGDGSQRYRTLLESASVHVTGWLSKDELARELSEGFAYVHTAVGEGFPISILDAAAFRLPIVARPISALRDSGLLTLDRAEQVMDQLERWHADEGSYDRGQRVTDYLNNRSSGAAQADQMRMVYASVCSSYRHSSGLAVPSGAPLERKAKR